MFDVNGIGWFLMLMIFWVIWQIFVELVFLFGFCGEQILDEYYDMIEYLYMIKYLDGMLYWMFILVEYIGDQEVLVIVFIVGDIIELNGILVIVKSWDWGEIFLFGCFNGYVYY